LEFGQVRYPVWGSPRVDESDTFAVPRWDDGRLSVQAYATEHETGTRPRWYVLVTSASGNSVFATMGPYPSELGAKNAAEGARVVHYRVGQAPAS
jgi:hypothetical protein